MAFFRIPICVGYTFCETGLVVDKTQPGEGDEFFRTQSAMNSGKKSLDHLLRVNLPEQIQGFKVSELRPTTKAGTGDALRFAIPCFGR
jgi:hypothetical protein